MYGFFTSLFMGKRDAEEPVFEPLTEEETTVTPTGFVIDLPGALTEYEAVLKELPQTSGSSEKISAFLRSELHLPEALPEVPDYRVARSAFLIPNYAAARFVLETEPGTTIRPVLMKAIRRECPLVPRGTSGTLHCAHLSALEELKERADEENLFILDVRGVGESRSIAGRSSRDDFFALIGRDSFIEGTAHLHGFSQLDGKVRDLLGAVMLLKEHGYEDLTLSGRGMGGLVAAYAAAAFKLPVQKIVLEEVPASLKALLEKRTFRLPNSVIPAGMLCHFDFPELYKFLEMNYNVSISCIEDVPCDYSLEQ
jgi:hypothetical protein